MFRIFLFVLLCTAIVCCYEAPVAPTIFDETYVQERYETTLRQLREEHGSTRIKVARAKYTELATKLIEAGFSIKIYDDGWCTLCMSLGPGECNDSCRVRGYYELDVDYLV